MPHLRMRTAESEAMVCDLDARGFAALALFDTTLHLSAHEVTG